MVSSDGVAPSFDLAKTRVARIHATALLGVAQDSGQAESLLAELGELVDHVVTRFPQFELILGSPRVSVEEKSALLDRVLRGRVSDLLLRFLQVVARHQRLDALRQIRRAAQEMYDEQRQRVRVLVTTAVALDGPLIDRIRHLLSEKLGREVVLETQVRPELIGGLIVRVGDTVFDSSIANQLSRMRRHAVDRTVERLRHESAASAPIGSSI
jgi:F-type H+-transporting ATPase subunit delta